MALIDKVKTARQRQTLRVDSYVANVLTPTLMDRTDRIYADGDLLALTVIDSGIDSRSRLQRLSNFEQLMYSIRGALNMVTDGLLSDLESLYLEYLAYGFEDAMEWGLDLGLPVGGSVFLPDSEDIFNNPQMQDRISSLGLAVVLSLEKHLLADLPRSSDPLKTVRKAIDQALGSALVMATGMTNLALWSMYRGGIFRQITQSNLDGWYWYATLDFKTCASCIALHGTWHPAWEELNDHPSGRCVPIPAKEGTLDLGSGAEWFEMQEDGVKQSILGPSRYRAYQDGAIDIEDFSTESVHPVYGSIRRAASLKEILGPLADDYYGNN